MVMAKTPDFLAATRPPQPTTGKLTAISRLALLRHRGVIASLEVLMALVPMN
jgi:hypothetical protein